MLTAALKRTLSRNGLRGHQPASLSYIDHRRYGGVLFAGSGVFPHQTWLLGCLGNDSVEKHQSDVFDQFQSHISGASPKIVNSSTASSLVEIEQLTRDGGRRAEDAAACPTPTRCCA